MRLLFPHGLGDVIQALPAFAALAQQRGEQLEVGVLERIPAARELLEAQPYVARVFGTRDPWRDFEPRDTWNGYRIGMAALEAEHGGQLVWTRPPRDPLDPAWCKALRIAQELGVEYAPAPPALGALWFATDAVRARAEIDQRGKPSFVVVHGSAGNPSKDVDVELLRQIAAPAKPSPSFAIPAGDASLAWHLGLLDRAAAFVGVDSGPAHLASCCPQTPVTWVFTETRVEQAIPLWRDVRVVVLGPRADELRRSWDRWSRANRHLVEYNVAIAEGVLHGRQA